MSARIIRLRTSSNMFVFVLFCFVFVCFCVCVCVCVCVLFMSFLVLFCFSTLCSFPPPPRFVAGDAQTPNSEACELIEDIVKAEIIDLVNITDTHTNTC